MVEPPRRLAPTPEERLKIITARVYGAAAGQTRFAGPIAPNGRPAVRSTSAAGAADTSGNSFNVVLPTGGLAAATGTSDVAIGLGASVTGDNGVALGGSSTATSDSDIAIGELATVDGSGGGSIGLGAGTEVFNVNAVAIGQGVSTTNDDDFILGNASHYVQVAGALGVAAFALTGGGAAPQSPQPTPTTLADVIGILQTFGFSL